MKKMMMICAVVSLFAWPIPVKAAPKERTAYSATYDVYAGGIHALQARLEYNDKSEKYDVSLASETYGLLGKLVPWSGKFSTNGLNMKNKRQPSQHISDTTFRGDRSVGTYHYGKNGQFSGFERAQNGKIQSTPKDLDMSISKDTTDLLSSTLEVMDQIAAGGDCTHTTKIFDSERSFYLTFNDLGTETLKKSDYTIFSGEAEKCSVEVKPDGGKWHKKPRGWLSIQEQGRKKGTMPSIWFAKLSERKDAPAIPVRVFLKTDYGNFFIHLTSFEEKPLK